MRSLVRCDYSVSHQLDGWIITIDLDEDTVRKSRGRRKRLLRKAQNEICSAVKTAVAEQSPKGYRRHRLLEFEDLIVQPYTAAQFG